MGSSLQKRKLGGENDEHGVIQSSIALLQERFKHLQRVKEMREKRELLRIFSHHNNINSDNNNVINISNNNSTITTILSTSTTTVSTTSNNNNNNNNNNNTNDNNNNPNDSAMQYSDGDDEKELQVFIPPNYYNYCKPSCYSSPSSLSSTSSTSPPSPSSSSSDNNSTEVSLSLWPSTLPCNVTPADHHFRPATTSLLLRPTKEMRRQSCISTAFKFEDSHLHHVSDVDTTLHL